MTKTLPKLVLSASRDIPFSQLVLSQKNVRRVKAGLSIEDLAEDIYRRTLLQSINVRPLLDADGKETGMFEVPAGGRRRGSIYGCRDPKKWRQARKCFRLSPTPRNGATLLLILPQTRPWTGGSGTPVMRSSDCLLEDIRACTLCAEHLPAGPRPIVQFSATSTIVIIGQAPGARVHESGTAWDDASGERLREWTGLTPDIFYDPAQVALVPMGFCYPGTGSSGDLPPRLECAPMWHDRVMAVLPPARLTLLVGSYAHQRYLVEDKKQSLTERVGKFHEYLPHYFPLPHPSWRSMGWMKRNPWFEHNVLPMLRDAIGMRIGTAPHE
jgi:uracil-DNA glycosylase